MKPTSIQVAADFYSLFKSAQELYEKDPSQAAFTLDDVISLINKYGIPGPDFNAWASSITNKEITNKTKAKLKLSRKIRAAMKAKGITVQQVAELTGKNKSIISRALSATNITLDTIVMFENVLDVKLINYEF